MPVGVVPGTELCGAQVKLVLTSRELLNKTSRKEIPCSELDDILALDGSRLALTLEG